MATALAMLFLDADDAIACVRREGVLRASRYDYKGSLIGRVAKAALGVCLLDTFPAAVCEIR